MHEGHLNTVLFLAFEKTGGMTSLLSAIGRLFDAMDAASSVPANARDESQKIEHIQAVGGVKVALLILSALVAPRALLENPQTYALQQRESGRQERFVDIFLQLRLDIFSPARRIWDAAWLTECPSHIMRLGVKTFLTIMEGRHEEHNPHSSVHPPLRPVPVADPARITQLIDMGFAREAAEFALLRARNNVAAAADLILSMPHLFQTEQVGPIAEPPDEVAGSADAAAPNIDEAADAAMDVDSTPPPLVRDQLRRLRDELRPDMASRAIVLLDHAEELVFYLIPAFPPDIEGISYLLDRIHDLTSSYDGAKEQALSARFRMLAIRLRSSDHVALNDSGMEKAREIFDTVKPDFKPRPRWLPTYLLFAESFFALSTPVIEIEIGEEMKSPIVGTNSMDTSSDVEVCIDLIRDDTATREDKLSALRLLVVLSRHSISTSPADIAALLVAFRQLSAKLQGCQPLLAMIVRHAFEDEATLKDVMRGEIRQWLSPSRNKVTDVNHFVRQLSQVALREPTLFVDSVEEECALVDPTPPQSVYHIRAKETRPQIDVFAGSGPRQSVIDTLLSELARAVRPSNCDSSQDLTAAHSAVGLNLSLLTELLGSYMPAKTAFMYSIRQHGLFGLHKGKGSFSTVVNDLICCVQLQKDLALTGSSQRPVESARRLAISGWSISMVVALCSDVTPPSDLKDPPAGLSTIRRTVLDVIAKALKDTAGPDASSRYGRLWALGELVYRLVSAKTSIAPPNQEDLHIAKTMLEKNYVGLLTTAIGEVDLNFPDVRNVLVSLLRALEHL